MATVLTEGEARAKPDVFRWKPLLLTSGLMLALITLAALTLFGYLEFYYAVLVIAFASYFPISYLAYLQFRSEIHKERVRDDFELLGLTHRGDGEARLDTIYGQIYSREQFVIYVSLVTLTTLLGFGLLFYSTANLSFASQQVAETMFYGFLGAYIFSIYYIFRRYSTLDLQPGVYLYITVRMITVGAVIFVAAHYLQATTITNQSLVAIAAFILGYFPDTGVRWLVSLVSRFFGKWINRNEVALSEIDGISLWHESRLRESGIDNAQNLAAADVRELLLGSRFSAQQLMHWIDQAILLTNVGPEKYHKLRERGIHTTSTFRVVYEVEGADTMAKISGLEKDEVTALYWAADTGPNLHYVSEYWKAVKEYRTQIVQRSLGNQLQNLGVQVGVRVAQVNLTDPRNLERLSEMMLTLDLQPQELEALFPDSVETLTGLGNVYIERQRYDDAVRVLTRAVQADGNRAPAFSSRGLARALQGDHAQAFDDFRRAEELDPDDAVTFNHEGAALILQEKLQAAIAPLDQAIALKPDFALAYYNRGHARRRLGQPQQAIEDLKLAVESDPEMDLAYHELGMAYLNAGQYPNAIRSIDEAIRRDRTKARPYHDRGTAYLALTDYRRALYDLDVAIELNPSLAAAYSSRGRARLELGDVGGSLADLDEALKQDPGLFEAYKTRALAHAEMGNLEMAQADFLEYLELRPDASDASQIRDLVHQMEQQADRDREAAVRPSRRAPAFSFSG